VRNRSTGRPRSRPPVSPTDASLLAPSDDSVVLVREERGSDAGMQAVHSLARPLARGGVTVSEYQIEPRPDGIEIVPSRPSGLHRRTRCQPDIAVVSTRSTGPGVVEAAVPGGRFQRAIFGRDPRRRVCFLVEPAGSRETLVVKVSRAGIEGRGAREQRWLATLQHLGFGPGVPQPFGHGTFTGREWSCESLAPGAPLAHAGRSWQRLHGPAAVDALARWLIDLGRTTAHAPLAPPDGRVLPLRGELAPRLAPVLDRVSDLPSILQHGDLASGENTMVAGRRVTVIDWETAVDHGIPLVDLVPTLALGMARLRGWHRPASQATYVLRLGAGLAPESGWFFDHVRDALRRLSIPSHRAGELAALAWGYQASMRLRHDELVRATGAVAFPWVSTAELIAPAWLDHDGIGLAWPALEGRRHLAWA
jgi:hypothetical protein